jgi:hypothetical protein
VASIPSSSIRHSPPKLQRRRGEGGQTSSLTFAGATFVLAVSDDGGGDIRGMTKALGVLGIEVAA